MQKTIAWESPGDYVQSVRKVGTSHCTRDIWIKLDLRRTRNTWQSLGSGNEANGTMLKEGNVGNAFGSLPNDKMMKKCIAGLGKIYSRNEKFFFVSLLLHLKFQDILQDQNSSVNYRDS